MISKDMNKRFETTKMAMCTLIFLLLFSSVLLPDGVSGFGFDSANSCTPSGKLSRRGRAQMLATIPCDLSQQAFCHLPGSAYPWHAVRRFVHENQGLMKRMYGDIRHISILRDEIQNNEIDVGDVESATDRYTKDAARQRSAKYMLHTRDDFFNYKTGNSNNNDVLMEPHFRPVSSSTTATTATTSSDPSALKSDSVLAKTPPSTTRRRTPTTTTVSPSTGDSPVNIESTTLKSTTNKYLENIDKLMPTMAANELSTPNDLEKPEDTDPDDNNDGDGEVVEIIGLTNIESNSVYAKSPSPVLSAKDVEDQQGEFIQMIDSPQFELHNLTSIDEVPDAVNKISTTLKVATKATSSQSPPPSLSPSRRPPIRRRPALQNQHQQQQHQQQLQAVNKVNLTILKESSNAKPIHSTTLKTTLTSSSTTRSTTTTANTNESERTSGISSAFPASNSAMVKGAQLSTTTKATSLSSASPTSSSSSSSLKTSSSTASIFRGYVHRNGSYGNFNSNNNNNNRRNHINNSHTTPKATTTKTVVTVAPSSASPVLSLKTNIDMVSSIDISDQQHKPQTSGVLPTTPSVVPTTGTKPVLHDGQLYQDTMKQETPPVLNSRGVNACPVKEEVVAPFWANNTRGEVLALLNLYPFEQYVHWEKCTHEHKQMYCRDGCRCEQQYRLHRLLAYDPHNECRGIFSDWFRFPSSCICKCYDIPIDFRATSRSPRSDSNFNNNDDGISYRDPIDVAEAVVKNAIYEHATEEWYRPSDDFDFYDG